MIIHLQNTENFAIGALLECKAGILTLKGHKQKATSFQLRDFIFTISHKKGLAGIFLFSFINFR